MIGMKGLKYILVIALTFARTTLFAQLQSLPEFYTSLSFSHQANNSDLRTTVYQPLTATNYIWGGSAWNFIDTTLYVYTATNKTASLTKKDNANNFISRILHSY